MGFYKNTKSGVNVYKQLCIDAINYLIFDDRHNITKDSFEFSKNDKLTCAHDDGAIIVFNTYRISALKILLNFDWVIRIEIKYCDKNIVIEPKNNDVLYGICINPEYIEWFKNQNV